MDHTVVFQDQTGRRRRLQLHEVDGQLRVNRDTALANYEAVSFTRQSDGLIIEPHGDSPYTHISFQPGEEVHVEAIKRTPDHAVIVKTVLDELDKLGVLAQTQHHYADPSTAQTDLSLGDGGASHQAGGVEVGLAMMQPAVTPIATAPVQPTEEYNHQGKKRRFCGACQNHNLKTPVTFQHQQTCQFRTCPCVACEKKRQISQAQASKRAAIRQGQYKSGHQQAGSQDGGSDGGNVDIIGTTSDQDQQLQHLQAQHEQQQQQLMEQQQVEQMQVQHDQQQQLGGLQHDPAQQLHDEAAQHAQHDEHLAQMQAVA
mmetsp:Transcript_15158/g.45700  ORF Transcript_15158/g.45700 Transcript_15158/m.45700 type:complete len:314 (-) Transcript_15158:545-1486(-)